ncbi:hypothetical protein VNO77_16860 [Canavalia gladiata]|uniref:Uncharacterized protein n=1 Tax=Canavalia gladiata TaxID=3824 RepID=A0AAN9LMS7_CANGL
MCPKNGNEEVESDNDEHREVEFHIQRHSMRPKVKRVAIHDCDCLRFPPTGSQILVAIYFSSSVSESIWFAIKLSIFLRQLSLHHVFHNTIKQ